MTLVFNGNIISNLFNINEIMYCMVDKNMHH